MKLCTIPGACTGNPSWPTSFSQSNSQRDWKISQCIAIPFIQVRPLHTTPTTTPNYTLHFTHYTLHTTHFNTPLTHCNTLATQHSQYTYQLINRCHCHWVKQEFIGIVWLVRLCCWRGLIDVCKESLDWIPHFSLCTQHLLSTPLSLSHPHNIN